jgi:hypothetical protein
MMEEIKQVESPSREKESMEKDHEKISRENPKDPGLTIWWIRYPNDAAANIQNSFSRPLAYAVVGGTGAGKSALVELFASKYRRVVDIYGSRDNEGLAWIRSQKHKNALLLKGGSATVDCNCAHVMNATDLTLKDMGAYDAIISVSAFYSKIEEEWYSLTKIMNKLWHRTHWTEPWCLAIREASSLIYSRLSIGDTQSMAKNHLIYVIKEMRHCGFAVALDTIRWMGVDVDFRSIADYTFLKAQGIDGLPSNLRFMYRYFEPSGIMRMPVEDFAVVSRKGPIGFGMSDCPAWHKQEHENLLEVFDIEVDYKELPHVTDGKMGAKVSDYEHVRIIKARLTLKGKTGDAVGMEELGKKLDRSSATIFKQIARHNNMVHGIGECDKCNRVGSEYAKVPAD